MANETDFIHVHSTGKSIHDTIKLLCPFAPMFALAAAEKQVFVKARVNKLIKKTDLRYGKGTRITLLRRSNSEIRCYVESTQERLSFPVIFFFNLVPRISHLPTPLSPQSHPGGRKKRDPGDEVDSSCPGSYM